MYVETVYSATVGNQTLSIKVAEQMETKNDAKIQAMKDVINAFVPPGKQGQIEVKCSPTLTSGPPKHQSLMSEYKQSNGQIGNSQLSSKSCSGQTSKDERITGPQIKLLRDKFKKRGISEREFCKQHLVDSIEDIPKHDAQWIIKEIIAEDNKH